MRLKRMSSTQINERLMEIVEQKVNEKFGQDSEEAKEVIEQMKNEAQQNGFGEDEYVNMIFYLDHYEE